MYKLRQLIELESSLIPSFSLIADVLAVLESAAKEYVRSLIVHI